MSFQHATKPQDLEPERLKPAQGAPILDASVEAEGPATDLCSGRARNVAARERIMGWLAEGVREVTWALCSLPRERWPLEPPPLLGSWPALRHLRHVALREKHQVLPQVRQALGESPSDAPAYSTRELEQADASWDARLALESAESLLHELGETRYELLQRLEAAPDEAWQQPAGDLRWLMLNMHQHEMQHLAAIWKIALNWDRVKVDKAPSPSVPLHPADRLEESH
jgi:DinB family protein